MDNKYFKLVFGLLFYISILPIQVYTFYIVMRWVVFIMAILLAFNNYKNDGKIPFPEIVILILWNPIFPIYLNKAIWIVFDIVAGSYYMYLYNKSTKINN